MDNFPLPAYIDPDAWEGFCSMRRAMPKTRPFTHRAAVLILKELQKIKDAGHDPNAALDQSTLKGWTDVYPAKDKEIERAKVVESTADYVARKAREKAESDAQRSSAPVGIFDAVKRNIALRRVG